MDHGIFIASYRTFHHGMGALEYAASVFVVPGLSCSTSCGILCPHAISEAAISEAPEAKARRRQWHPTPVLLPGKSHGLRSLVGCSPWGRTESDTTEQLHFHFSLSCIGEGNGNPLQCSCLENPRDGGACWAAVYGVAAQSRTRLKRLSSSSSSIQIASEYSLPT